VVCCPEGFWRIENVEMTCLYTKVCLVDTFEAMVAGVRKRL
jgi:hypothetical protein